MGRAKEVTPSMLDTNKKPRRLLHNLQGNRYGKLTVIKYYGISDKNQIYWFCKCECGKGVYVKTADLMNGTRKSCGCMQLEIGHKNYRYGCRTNRLYTIWRGIKARCLNANAPNYTYYGGRGISICDEWLHSFDLFQSWALNNGYSNELTIDRVDVNGNYCPENCKWSTVTQQNNNKRNNRYLTINGRIQTLSEWCREYRADRDKVKTNMKKYSLIESLKRGVKDG